MGFYNYFLICICHHEIYYLLFEMFGKIKLGQVSFMSQKKVCQTTNKWFGHHPSQFVYFSTSHIKNAILYVKPKLYFKSIIFVFSIVIFVKLHLGVDLQAYTSKLRIRAQESYLHFSKHSH